ncbi:MAG: hypothetical protein Q9M39_08545 [Sulfurovum sp.]|nr:hypothetical protein [Sulfurovum sp.]
MNYRYKLLLSMIVSIMLLSGCGSNTSSVRSADENIVDENTTENIDVDIIDTIDLDTSNPEDSNAPLALREEPYYKYLWHIDSNTGDIDGIEINPNADINITEAWTISRGKNVKIAVIDDAFDVEHEDLKDNIIATYNVDDGTNDVSNKTPLGGDLNGGSHGNTCRFYRSPYQWERYHRYST